MPALSTYLLPQFGTGYAPSSGTPGTRDSSGDGDGRNKGPGSSGNDRTQDALLDIPEPIHVYEKDWTKNDPAFDKFTAMRIKRPPETIEGEEKYDFYVNMDNVHLQTYLKAKPKLAEGMKLRYSVGMTLIALAVLHQDQLRQKGGQKIEDMPDDSVHVQDRVAQTTSAMAPFLLPMIESVADLEVEEEPLSAAAGEAA